MSTEFRRRQSKRLRHTVDLPKPATPPPPLSPLACQVATQAQIDSLTYWRWCEELAEPPQYHRKQWEFVYMLQVLEEIGMLRPGVRGLGFGVGREPIPSLLPKRACDVLVTDLDPSAAEDRGWRSTHQHATSVDELHRPDLIALDVFRRHVRFRRGGRVPMLGGLRVRRHDPRIVGLGGKGTMADEQSAPHLLGELALALMPLPKPAPVGSLLNPLVVTDGRIGW